MLSIENSSDKCYSVTSKGVKNIYLGENVIIGLSFGL